MNQPTDLDDAIATLEIALDNLRTNEPIFRAEGRIEEADAALRRIASVTFGRDILIGAKAVMLVHHLHGFLGGPVPFDADQIRDASESIKRGASRVPRARFDRL